MAAESVSGANSGSGPNDDPVLAFINQVWSTLPLHRRVLIDNVARGINTERVCPRCLAGRTKCPRSHQEGDRQIRQMICVECGYEFRQGISRDLVAKRRRPKRKR